MKWEEIFDETIQEIGATESEIHSFCEAINQPLTDRELSEVFSSQSNPFHEGHDLHTHYRHFDAKKWVLPARPLSSSFLDFLRWSNGGWARTGKREFGFFSTFDLREMMLAYHIPQYMPYAIPFAFNGGGFFYLFDLRKEPVDDEYPIVCAAAGNLGWNPDENAFVAATFHAACIGITNIEELLH